MDNRCVVQVYGLIHKLEREGRILDDGEGKGECHSIICLDVYI